MNNSHDQTCNQLISLFVIALASLAIGGCGSANEAVQVAGAVEFEGKPIESGDIRFVPEVGTTGSVAGSQITNGQYRLQGKQALGLGDYRIEVSGYRNSDGSKGPVDRRDAEANYVQYLPSKYNTHSELRITIKDDSTTELQHDLALTN